MKRKRVFEPHLAVQETRLLKSSEWQPRFRGWCLLQIRSGICYWQQASQAVELLPGSSMVLSNQASGLLRASQLSEVAIAYFCVRPEKIIGLLSLTEREALKNAAQQPDRAIQTLSDAHPISERFKALGRRQAATPVSLRLQLLQLFLDLFASEMAEAPVIAQDGRSRLRQLLNQMAESELVELSLADLEPKMNCSARHLSRLFRQEVGTSFREKQMTVRLEKACELLTTSDAKVVDVALQSGYPSSSLFSESFKKHLGMTPRQWRRGIPKSTSASRLPLECP